MWQSKNPIEHSQLQATGAIHMASFLSYTLSSLLGEDLPSMSNSARPRISRLHRVKDGSMDLSKVVHFTVKEVLCGMFLFAIYGKMEPVVVCIPISSALSAMFV